MDLDFLDGFDTDLDWGFTTTDAKPSETKDTEAVAKTAASAVSYTHLTLPTSDLV